MAANSKIVFTLPSLYVGNKYFGEPFEVYINAGSFTLKKQYTNSLNGQETCLTLMTQKWYVQGIIF